MLELIAALWVVTLFIAVFFWLPSQFFSIPKEMSCNNRIISYWVRMVLITVTGTLTLSGLHLFSWFVLVLFYCGCFLLIRLHRDRDQQIEQFKLRFQHLVCLFFDVLDRGLLPEMQKAAARSFQVANNRLADCLRAIRIATPQEKLALLALTAILTFATLLRFEHPLLELRFGEPDNYRTLLATRQILAGEQPQTNYFPVMPALAAVISLLGAIDAMHVIRFLGPILGILLVLSAGYNVQTLTKNGSAALVTMFCLGVYLFSWHWDIPSELPNWLQQWLRIVTEHLNSSLTRQWAGNELEIGSIFLLLAIACGSRAGGGKQRQSVWIDTVCCIAIVAMTAPILLILVLVGGIGLIGGRALAVALVAISWVLLGLLVAMHQEPFHWGQSFLLTLPIGLSLLWGLLFIFIAWLFRLVLGRWSETVCFMIIFAVSINFLLPLSAKVSYLEYEMAARKTLELRHRFPLKSWAIAAPVEQFAQSYGAGWYEDLALFVEKYAKDAGKANFQFPFSVPHLFIFGEKKPFIRTVPESQDIPYSLLSDPTYAHYRSAVGRASLQYQTLQMCEAYRRTHANASIYYEDEELRIYQVQLAGRS
jgi:hypothetical protein